MATVMAIFLSSASSVFKILYYKVTKKKSTIINIKLALSTLCQEIVADSELAAENCIQVTDATLSFLWKIKFWL